VAGRDEKVRRVASDALVLRERDSQPRAAIGIAALAQDIERLGLTPRGLEPLALADQLLDPLIGFAEDDFVPSEAIFPLRVTNPVFA
jgi:hypothetical protein